VLLEEVNCDVEITDAGHRLKVKPAISGHQETIPTPEHFRTLPEGKSPFVGHTATVTLSEDVYKFIIKEFRHQLGIGFFKLQLNVRRVIYLPNLK